jgi:hypothetical protein
VPLQGRVTRLHNSELRISRRLQPSRKKPFRTSAFRRRAIAGKTAKSVQLRWNELINNATPPNPLSPLIHPTHT